MSFSNPAGLFLKAKTLTKSVPKAGTTSPMFGRDRSFSAARVKTAMEVTMYLGGENYVLWGGREGYASLMNTDSQLEKENLAEFLRLVRKHADEIGFTGKLLIEPKAYEPTAHQWDHDATTVIGFLYEHGLQDDNPIDDFPELRKYWSKDTLSQIELAVTANCLAHDILEPYKT